MRHWIDAEYIRTTEAERDACRKEVVTLAADRDAARAELAKAIQALDAANAPNVALMQERDRWKSLAESARAARPRASFEFEAERDEYIARLDKMRTERDEQRKRAGEVGNRLGEARAEIAKLKTSLEAATRVAQEIANERNEARADLEKWAKIGDEARAKIASLEADRAGSDRRVWAVLATLGLPEIGAEHPDTTTNRIREAIVNLSSQINANARSARAAREELEKVRAEVRQTLAFKSELRALLLGSQK